MKHTVTEPSACKRSLAVEVPPEVVEAEYDKACREFGRKVRLDGFRKGKVPRHILETRFGKEIEQEVVEHLIHDSTQTAIDDAGLSPLHTPVLKDYKFERGKGLSFTTEFEVRPKVTAHGYRGLKIERKPVEVNEVDVLGALDDLRERRARYEGVEDRGVAPGDWILADVSGTVDGAEGEAFSKEDAFFEVGSAGPHPEMSDEIRDMRPGTERTFGVKYPQDHPSSEVAGKRIVYRVKLKEIKTKRLPEIGDEFAREVGPFGSLEELRRKVQEDLQELAASREKSEARRQVFERILEANPDIEVPDTLVDDSVEGFVEEMVHSMVAQGVDPRTARVDWEEMRRRQRDPARRSVRGMLLLDAIAEQEKISVDPADFDAAVDRDAARRGVAPDVLRAKWQKEGRIDALKRQILREKVLDFLLSSSII